MVASRYRRRPYPRESASISASRAMNAEVLVAAGDIRCTGVGEQRHLRRLVEQRQDIQGKSAPSMKPTMSGSVTPKIRIAAVVEWTILVLESVPWCPPLWGHEIDDRLAIGRNERVNIYQRASRSARLARRRRDDHAAIAPADQGHLGKVFHLDVRDHVGDMRFKIDRALVVPALAEAGQRHRGRRCPLRRPSSTPRRTQAPCQAPWTRTNVRDCGSFIKFSISGSLEMAHLAMARR